MEGTEEHMSSAIKKLENLYIKHNDVRLIEVKDFMTEALASLTKENEELKERIKELEGQAMMNITDKRLTPKD